MNPVRSYLTSLGSSQTAILGILCLGVFSTALDQTVVVAALPSVMLDLGNTPYGPGQGILDRNRIPGQLYRSHAVGGAPVRCLWTYQDVPSCAGPVLHRVGG